LFDNHFLIEMDIGQAFSMRHVGAITGATVIERPTANGSVWIVEFVVSKKPPAFISTLLEVARGGPKIFKSVQAALNDVKSVGIANPTVQFTAAESFRANRFEWLYEWIRGLPPQGYDEEQILQAFTTNPATRLDLADDAAVKLARIIIRHALGQCDGAELEAYLPPVEVLDVRFIKATEKGYLCQATCADSSEDFKFLVSLDVPEKTLKYVVADRKSAMCKFVLVAAHRRNPQGYDDPDIPPPATGAYSPPVAAFKLTLGDINCIRELSPGADNIIANQYD
jgi:hypothetical protein